MTRKIREPIEPVDFRDEIDERLKREEVSKLLETLTPYRASIIHQRYILGLSVKEIAKNINILPKSVYPLINSSLRRLKYKKDDVAYSLLKEIPLEEAKEILKREEEQAHKKWKEEYDKANEIRFKRIQKQKRLKRESKIEYLISQSISNYIYREKRELERIALHQKTLEDLFNEYFLEHPEQLEFYNRYKFSCYLTFNKKIRFITDSPIPNEISIENINPEYMDPLYVFKVPKYLQGFCLMIDEHVIEHWRHTAEMREAHAMRGYY